MHPVDGQIALRNWYVVLVVQTTGVSVATLVRRRSSFQEFRDFPVLGGQKILRSLIVILVHSRLCQV